MSNLEVLINRAKAAFEEAQKGGNNGHLSMYVVIRDFIQFFEPPDDPSFNQSGIFKSGLLHLQFGMLMMEPMTDMRTLTRFAEEHGMKLTVRIEGDAPDVQN